MLVLHIAAKGGDSISGFYERSIKDISQGQSILGGEGYSSTNDRIFTDLVLVKHGASVWPHVSERQGDKRSVAVNVKLTVAERFLDIVWVYGSHLFRRLTGH